MTGPVDPTEPPASPEPSVPPPPPPAAPVPVPPPSAPPGTPPTPSAPWSPTAPAGGAGRPSTSTNGFAIASLVLGIAQLFCCVIGTVLALVFGYIAKRQIDESGGTQGGRGMAIAGIVLGWIGVGLIGLYILILIVAALTG